MTQVNLPPDLDFALDPSASSDRMNRAMVNLQLRLAALETYKPNFDALFASLQQIGLTRLSDALTPIYDQVAALLTSMSAGNVVDSGTYDPVARLIDVKLLHSSTAGVAPTTLSFGQVALNDADGKLYWLAADGHTINSLDLTLAAYALINSPALTGTPTAPTATLGTNTTQISTTAFVQAAIAALINAAPGALDTLKELADAIGDDANFATTMTTALGNRLRVDASGSYTTGQQLQGRTNLYAAPFDALAYNGLQTNGAMDVSQERGATALTTVGHVVDGWSIVSLGAQTFSAAQVADAPSGLSNSIKVTITGANASPGAGEYLFLNTAIEGFRTSRLAFGTASAQPVSIGFRTKIHRAGTYSGAIKNNTSDRSYVFSFTQNVADTWEFKTVTVPGDVAGTWIGNTNGVGLQLCFTIACGTTYSGAANTWLASNTVSVSGNINGMAATTDAFQITGVIVIPGIELPSAARAPLIMRSFDQELIVCKRAYQASYDYGIIPGSVTTAGRRFGVAQSVNDFYDFGYTQLHPVMRAAPTATVYSPSSGAPGKLYNLSSLADVNGSASSSIGVIGVGGLSSSLTVNALYEYHWVADARL